MMERQAPATATAAAHPATHTGNAPASLNDTETIATLTRERQTLHHRLTVTKLVIRDVSPYLSDQANIDLIVEDVLRLWQQHPQNTEPTELDGPNGFWNRYADRVEFAPPGQDDDYRAEFCPPGPARIDIADYYTAVWQAHTAQLRAQGVATSTSGSARAYRGWTQIRASNQHRVTTATPPRPDPL